MNLAAAGPTAASAVGRKVWGVWVLTRLAGVLLLTGTMGYPQVDKDILEYQNWAHLLYAGYLPWHTFPVEYPAGVLPFMAIPGGPVGYELEFLAIALLADIAIVALLSRGSSSVLGTWLWVLLPIALGPVLWVRFDIFVALALVGAVTALRNGRWRLAGACVAAATLLKLWPIVLVVVLWRLIPAGGRRQVVTWAIGVTVAGTAPVLALGGGSGLLWMLRFQGGRGIEMESVLAWPAIVAHALGSTTVFVSGHGSTELPISGLTADAVSLVLPVMIVIVAAVVWRDRGRRLTYASSALLVVAVVLIGSKVLSAQYVVWAVAMTAVVIDEIPPRARARRFRLVGACLALAVATQVVFPFYFLWVALETESGLVAATVHAAAVMAWFATIVVEVSISSRRQDPTVREGLERSASRCC